MALLKDQIGYHHKNKFRFKKDIGYIENLLYHRVTESDFKLDTLFKEKQTLSAPN